MTKQSQTLEQRSNSGTDASSVPAFKPVALPALAAAMRSARTQPGKPKEATLPAILRKEAAVGH
jgi:hypothetical protein